MTKYLTYRHTRNIFVKEQWKSFVTKYFQNPVFQYCKYENNFKIIAVDNYEEVKDKLPKYAQPIKVQDKID